MCTILVHVTFWANRGTDGWQSHLPKWPVLSRCAVCRTWGCTLSKRKTWNRTWQWGAKWEDKMFPELWGHIFDKVPLLVSFWSEDFTMTTVLHVILETWNRKSTYNTSIAYIYTYICMMYIFSLIHIFMGIWLFLLDIPKRVPFVSTTGWDRGWDSLTGLMGSGLGCTTASMVRLWGWRMDDPIPIGSMGLVCGYPPWKINSQFAPEKSENGWLEY